MSTEYEKSYYGQLRKVVGNQKLIHIGARAIIQDALGRILLIRRSDDGDWAMPAGSMELDESILDCVKREVKEETGLNVLSAFPIAIYSDPQYSFVTSYGDPYQMFRVVFVVDQWEGDLSTQTTETTDARFFSLDALPDLPDLYQETLDDLRLFDGRVIVK